jgi:hypothetical protein
METYVLLKDFDWFGKKIAKGAIYRQYISNADMYACYTTEGMKCPHNDLTFMTVRANKDWFLELNQTAIGAAFMKNQ